MKALRLLPLLAVLAVFSMSACDSTVEDETVALTLGLEAFVGTTPLATGAQEYSINGRQTTIESARFYLSEITLLKSDGSETLLLADAPLTTVARDSNGDDVAHTVTEEVLLVKHDLGMTDYALGEVDAGDYSGMRFKVGLSGLTNKVDASQVASTHPLAAQTDKGNHWSWNAGYIFLRLDGLVDTDNDSAVDSTWDVHLGTANFLNTITLNESFTLSESSNTLQVNIDYSKFLTGLDYSDTSQLLCHTMDNIPVAQVVSANVASAFSLHGTK